MIQIWHSGAVAIVVRGKSRCKACGQVLAKGEELVLFPAALFGGPDHPLHHLWDAAVHRTCFECMPERQEALEAINAYAAYVQDVERRSS